MDNVTPNVRLRDIAKYPIAYVVAFVCMLGGGLMYAYINSNSTGMQNCEAEKAALRIMLDSSEARKERVTNQLLIVKGALEQVAPTVDSLAKKK